jgi:phage terminase small subunit
MADKKLTPKQEQFVREYLIDLNATQAAKRAGYSERTAYSQGQRLLKDVEIQQAITEAMNNRAQRTGITADRVLQEYARLGFFDPRKLFHDNGQPKEISELDDDTAAALAGLDLVEIYEGTGEDRKFVGYTKKYKIADKKGALDSIAKHLGMFVDRTEITGKDGGPIQVSRISDLSDDELEKLAAE